MKKDVRYVRLSREKRTVYGGLEIVDRLTAYSRKSGDRLRLTRGAVNRNIILRDRTGSTRFFPKSKSARLRLKVFPKKYSLNRSRSMVVRATKETGLRGE